MSVAQAQRLRELEVLLRWEGELDNARLRQVFDIQAVQASRLIAAFVSDFGDAVSRASPHAPVRPTARFKPRYAGNSPDEYLQLLAERGFSGHDAYLQDVRLDLYPVDADIFAPLAQACRSGKGVRIMYRSLEGPKGEERVVFPHSLVRAARRWHARAWCVKREAFRDFVLGRIASATVTDDDAPKGAPNDDGWTEIVELVVVAHPALSKGQARLLQDEYLGGRAHREVRIRRCLAGYTAQDLRIAIEPEQQRPPAYQLALKNADRFKGDFGLSET